VYPSAYVCPLARAWHRHRHQHRQFPVLFSFSSDSGQRKLVQSSKMAKKKRSGSRANRCHIPWDVGFLRLPHCPLVFEPIEGGKSCSISCLL